ncbi:MAG: hypothetical protein K5668_10840 [Lachnospiraceae bacterium]|nr:hypothetical protein [Lachnospiraceae bacterium]
MIETAVGMFKKLTGNMGLKLVSLFLAFLLWLFVVSIENPVMNLSFSSIPITIENADVMEDQGKAFELNDSSRTVTVTVKAERSVLSELSRDNIKATIDMTELNGNKVPIEVKSTRYSDRIQSISPSKEFANVIIEDLASSQFKIQVETSGSLPDGYAIGTTSVQNNVVRVKGPQSVVNSIAEAVVRVNVSGMTSEIHTVLPILLLDADGDQVDTAPLEVSLDQVSASVEIWKVVEIPVYGSYKGVPAQGYAATGTVTAEPATVFVTGDSKNLNAVRSVTIPDTELDITNATGNVSAEVNISSYLPDGIYPDPTHDEDTVTLTAHVEKADAQVIQVPYSNLTVNALPDNMTIGNDMDTSMVAVTVHGLKASLSQLNGNTITGVLDLSEVPLNENGTITPGSYAGAVKLNLPDGIYQDTAVAHVLLQMKGEAAEDTEGDETAAAEGRSDTSNTNEPRGEGENQD